MSKTFQQRLLSVLQGGNLTVADLARWFERPDPTVRGWVMRGGTPSGGPLDVEQVMKKLARLELLIEQGRHFPFPRLSPSERIERLLSLKKR